MPERRRVTSGGPGDPPEEQEEERPGPEPRPGPGPGPGPEPEPEPQARRTVELGGRKFELEPGLADALDAYRTEADNRDQQNRRAIEELYGRIPKPPEARDAPVNFDTLLFEKPSEALRLYGERIKKELQDQYAQDQNQQAQVRIMEKFWADFYGDHPELREDDVLVRSVFGGNVNAFLDMTPNKARTELAGLVKTELNRIATRYGAPGGGGGANQVESGTRTRRGPGAERPPPNDQGPKSLSDALRMRREARLRPITRQREAG